MTRPAYAVDAWGSRLLIAIALVVGACPCNSAHSDTFPVDGLFPGVWLKADSITDVANGGVVTLWTDSSGNGNSVSAAFGEEPSYVASDVSYGLPTLRFNGATSQMTNSEYQPELPLTIFAVVKNDGLGPSAIQGYFGGGYEKVALGANVTTPFAAPNSFWAWTPGEPNTYGLANSFNLESNILAYALPAPGSPTWTGYQNGVQTGAAALTAGAPFAQGLYASGIFVGRTGNLSNGIENWSGDISELIVFESELTASQIGDVNQYLAEKYVAIPGPSSDFNKDNQVDGEDLAVWTTAFGPGAGADADGDGDSDGADFLIWQQHFGGLPVVPAFNAVPEPASEVVLVTAVISCFALRHLRRSPRDSVARQLQLA